MRKIRPAQANFLQIYVRNQKVPLTHYILAAVLFGLARIYLYGFPDRPLLIYSSAALCIGGFSLLRQQRLYQRLIDAPDQTIRSAMTIAGNKLLYLLPWLGFVFWPLRELTLFSHLLGYFFVFCAVALYASNSIAMITLLLWDIGVVLGFACVVTCLNWDVPDTPYIGGLLILFGVYAVINGRKTGQTTVQITQSRDSMERSARAAEQATQAKSTFLAIMSHEIRTPMAGILSTIDFLKETVLSPEQEECIGTIDICSRTLLNTLNDALDLSHLETGKLQISFVNFDYHAAVADALRVVRANAEEKNLRLGSSIAADVPRLIRGDPNRLQQIIVNLLSNAVKFTEAGGVEVVVSLRAASTPGIRTEIRDTGIGISALGQENLFKEFSQADDSIARRYGGSGLGLSISKRLAELMDGVIGVESKQGEGSVFWFEIPYHEPSPDPAPNDAPVAAALPPMDILLVEDNRINQMIASRMLTAGGHRVTIAASGENGLRQVQRGAFDLVLMDLTLPVKSGIETARDIRRLGGRYAALPIVALTANGAPGDIRRCNEAGMNGHILKPLSVEALGRALAAHAPDGPMETELSENRAAALAEEFGEDYARHFLASSADEIEALLKGLQAACHGKDVVLARREAHDLKSVAGAAGLPVVEITAALVERLLEGRTIVNLAAPLARLERTVSQGARLLRAQAGQQE